MRENFDTALEHVLAYEGGYVNHPRDPGGATNKGVTHRTYDAWRRKNKLTTRSVKLITDDEVRIIYREQYAARVQFAALPSGVDFAVFDYAVNSGVSRASKELQRVVGAGVDGDIGLQTLAKVDDLLPGRVIDALCDRRMHFLKRLKTWPTFGRGWTARVDRVRHTAKELMAKAPVVAPRPLPTPSAKSNDNDWSLLSAFLAAIVNFFLALTRSKTA